MWENTDQKKIRIWTLFTQCELSFKDGQSKEKKDTIKEDPNNFLNVAPTMVEDKKQF